MNEIPNLNISKKVLDPANVKNILETIICGSFNVYKWDINSNFKVFLDNGLVYEGKNNREFIDTLECLYIRRGIKINNSKRFKTKDNYNKCKIILHINFKKYNLDLICKEVPNILKNKYNNALLSLDQMNVLYPGSKEAILLNIKDKDSLTQINIIESMVIKLF